MQADQMGERKPQALQYGAIQQMLFAMGIMLGMGVLTESGVLSDIGEWIYKTCFQNVWLMGALSGLLSSIVDTFTVAMTNVSFFPVSEGVFAKNGIYWLIIAFSTAMGGSLLTIGSTSGIALMRMENMRMGWYFRHLTWKVLLGFLSGLAVLYVESLFF